MHITLSIFLQYFISLTVFTCGDNCFTFLNKAITVNYKYTIPFITYQCFPYDRESDILHIFP